MSSLYDRFFAFFNGMVAGTTPFTQDGPRYSSCSPSKSSKSDYKPKASITLSTKASAIASEKSSKIKDPSPSTKVHPPLSRHPHSSSWRWTHGLHPIRTLRKLQKEHCSLVRFSRTTQNPHPTGQNSRCFRCRYNFLPSRGTNDLSQCPV